MVSRSIKAAKIILALELIIFLQFSRGCVFLRVRKFSLLTALCARGTLHAWRCLVAAPVGAGSSRRGAGINALLRRPRCSVPDR